MARIPVITAGSMVSPETAIPSTEASPAAFGAQVGEAMIGEGAAIGGLGQSIAQLGSAVGGYMNNEQNRTRSLAVNTALANNSFTPTYLDTAGAQEPGSTDLPDKISEAYDKQTEDIVKASGFDTKGEYAFRQARLSGKSHYMEEAYVGQHGQQEQYSKDQSDSGLQGLINNAKAGIGFLGDPFDPKGFYQKQLAAGYNIIAAQPYGNATARAEAGKKWSRDFAAAYWSGQIEAASTDRATGPTTAAALYKVLSTDQRWQAALGDGYGNILKQLRGVQAGAVKGMSDQIGARLYQSSYINDHVNLIPPKEMVATRRMIDAYGNDKQKAEWVRIEEGQKQIERDGKAPYGKWLEYQAEAAATTTAPIKYGTTGDATAFLLKRLNPGHPARYITEMDPRLQVRIAKMLQDPSTPQYIRDNLTIMSGARHLSDQENIPGYGHSRMVGGPGSHHVVSHTAVDFGWHGHSSSYIPKEARAWLAQNAQNFGIVLPARMKGLGEYWHFEVQEASGGGAVATGAAGGDMGHVPVTYRPLFEQYGTQYGVDPGLLAAMGRQESGFNPNVQSPAGAQGLMQFMPKTAARFGVNPHDPASSVEGAAKYMQFLLARYKNASVQAYGRTWGQTELAVAAYNAGEGSVDLFLRGKRNLKPETLNYVAKVLGGQADALAASETGAPVSMTDANGAPVVFDPNTGDPSAPYRPTVNTAAVDMYEKMKTNQQQAVNADLMTYSAERGTVQSGAPLIGPGGQLAPPEVWQARGEDFSKTMQAYGPLVSPENATATTVPENNMIQSLLANGNTDQKAQLFDRINHMNGEAQAAMKRQIASYDAVGAVAGHVYNTDPAAGRQILEGQKYAKDPNLGAIELFGGAEKVNAELNAQMGTGLFGMTPEDAGAYKQAVIGVYLKIMSTQPRSGQKNQPSDVDPVQMAKAVGIVFSGMQFDTVNSFQTLLPPQITADQTHDTLDGMDATDVTKLSADGQAPMKAIRDTNGELTGGLMPVPVSQIADESSLQYVAQDRNGYYYKVMLGDGQYATTAKGTPYIMKFTAQEIALRAEAWNRTPSQTMRNLLNPSAPDVTGLGAQFDLGGLMTAPGSGEGAPVGVPTRSPTSEPPNTTVPENRQGVPLPAPTEPVSPLEQGPGMGTVNPDIPVDPSLRTGVNTLTDRLKNLLKQEPTEQQWVQHLIHMGMDEQVARDLAKKLVKPKAK